MSKHKKTRAQKEKSDMRKNYNTSSQNTTSPTQPSPFSLHSYQFTAAPKSPLPTPSSASLTHGLEKSLIVSSVIVILQLAIFFLMTHHILVLPWKLLQY